MVLCVALLIVFGGCSRPDSVVMLSENEAQKKVLAVLAPIPPGFSLRVDRTEEREGRKYYVIQYAEFVVENPETGEGHTATSGWYYVDFETGKVFSWNLVEDVLIDVRADS